MAGMAIIRSTLHMILIVNRGVATGGGNSMRYGGSFLSLFRGYRRYLLFAQNSDFKQTGAAVLMVTSTIQEDFVASNCGNTPKRRPTKL